MSAEQKDSTQLPVVQPPYEERLPVPVAPLRASAWRIPLSKRTITFCLSGFAALTVAALAGRFAKEHPSRSPASDAPAAMREGSGLTPAQLNDRIRGAILQTLSQKVVYADVLGEGPGAWDSKERFPREAVNCILWIQEVLALAFSPQAPSQAMDALRYYGGVPAFGMRKHFNAHWIEVEPSPLHALGPETCSGFRDDRVKIDYARFAHSNQYECPLYRSDIQEISYSYLPPADLLSCAPQLNSGFYVLFGVATDRYEKTYGRKTGPMGLVHGILLEVTLTGEAYVYHASTSAGAIRKESLSTYTRRMQRELHRGYTLYSIDPSWTPRLDLELTPEIQKIIRCESELKGPRPKTNSFQNPVRD